MAREAQHALRVLLSLQPVQPVQRAVVAVRVVVPDLAVPVLVAHVDHGHAVGHQERDREVTHLALT